MTAPPTVKSRELLGASLPPSRADAGGAGAARDGALALLAFMRRNHMLRARYLRLVARLLRRRFLSRYRSRLELEGLCFIGRGVVFELSRAARLRLGRWSWIGDGTKVRCHEGIISIGEKTVIGQDCTLSAYQSIAIGRECMIADRVMMIDFDHVFEDVERPIRAQGIDKRSVSVGNNVWVGYGAAILRGVVIGDNAVVAASSVVTTNVPANAVVGGVPARLIRMRQQPRTLRWS